ncbi:diguanylate cyclase [Pseudomonas sp. NY15437]|uniref:sensor domain-containing diguanylate cyclase n=1 Tax=Pseudomonas sp. NY15437 TaxID=3400360 RepID=UPI003A895867
MNDLYATYRIQRETLVHNSLEFNRAYAAKVALTIGQSLGDDLARLEYSSRIIGEDFDHEAQRGAEARRLAEQDNSFNTVIIADSQGRIVSSFPPSLSVNGQTLRSKEPLEERKAMISPAFSSLVGNLIVFVSQPIWSQEGKYLGLVGGTIYLHKDNALNEIISKHFHQDSSYVYLVDEKRQLLFHPDPNRIGEQVGSNAAVDAVLRGESGAASVRSSTGRDMLAGYAAVPHSGWGVISQQPLSVPLTTLRTLMWRVVVGIIPMSLLGLILLWWAATHISQPLSQLAEYAEQRASEEGIRKVRAWYVEAWRIRRAMIIAAILTQERIGKLNHQAYSDPLTGLGNRRVMERALEDWRLCGKCYAVISMDIDHFKRVNDMHGHAVGDKVLQAFARLLKQNCRDDDLACRIGGEEFILLLPQTDLVAAAEVAERVRHSLESTPIPPAGQVTLSLGVACSEDGQADPIQILARADKLLYQAKKAGRNRVVATNSVVAGIEV